MTKTFLDLFTVYDFFCFKKGTLFEYDFDAIGSDFYNGSYTVAPRFFDWFEYKLDPSNNILTILTDMTSISTLIFYKFVTQNKNHSLYYLKKTKLIKT